MHVRVIIMYFNDEHHILYCFSTIHSSTAHSREYSTAATLTIFNFGFAIWGNEWLSSRFSCETDIWLIHEPWMIQVQKFKVRSVILWKEHYSTLKEYFKMLIYKVTLNCEVSPSAGPESTKAEKAGALEWPCLFLSRAQICICTNLNIPWNLLGSLKHPLT